jgi:hypothetical protein
MTTGIESCQLSFFCAKRHHHTPILQFDKPFGGELKAEPLTALSELVLSDP